MWKVAGAAIMAFTVTSAFAQMPGQPCFPRNAVIKQLEERYQERKIGGGLAGNTTVAELYQSEAGTWTFLVTTANGLACIMAGGSDWQVETPKPGRPL